uniref:R-spondin 3 n=1 Tax=Scleropages formosus TaxID=113540 RepID=A0A8C9T9W9_SCLFO
MPVCCKAPQAGLKSQTCQRAGSSQLSDKLFFFFSESIPGTPRTSCYGGCLTCSDSNGCLSCKPRYFFLLDRLGMRQVGMCLLSCPSGYYHIRSRDINKCSKCQLDCDCDFTGNFCTRCRQGLYLLQGKCHSACPEEFFANEQLMECKPQVHCEVGEWGSWSPCFRGGSTCGFKLGEQIRTRDVLLVTPSNSHPCPAVSEKRDCISKKKKCPGRDRKNKTDRKIRSSRQEGSERENGKQMRDWADAVNRNITKSW